MKTKKEKFELHTYKASKREKYQSVYVLSNEDFETEEAIEYLINNYDTYYNCELVEENEPAVASYLGYKYCVVFHEKLNS